MKIRTCFVSNSSSSSFTLAKYNLTGKQVDQIRDHIIVAKETFPGMEAREEDTWNIEEDDYSISGRTLMNNFDMDYFLLEIGIDEKLIHVRDC